MSQPNDPMTALMEAASMTHEMFKSYINAGFTEQQALYLVSQLVISMVQSQIGNVDGQSSES
jgi:hypothetical protein